MSNYLDQKRSENNRRADLKFNDSTRSIRSVICVDAYYYTKKNEQREEQYQKVIEKNQQVIEEQAKAFSSLAKDLSDVKQKILGHGDMK